MSSEPLYIIKNEKKPTDFYYNPHKCLSYDRLFNFIIGMRRLGKTFAFTKWAVKDFLKKGGHFIYVRRFKSELKDLEKFFDNIAPHFPDHELKVKGHTAYCDNKACGYFITLSTATFKKSVSYPKVDKIIFDEFLIEKEAIHYLPNEPQKFENLWLTVDSYEDRVRCYFLANSESIINPYFVHYKCVPTNPTQQFILDGEILIEQNTSKAMQEHVKKSRGHNILKRSSTYEFAVENKYKDYKTEFIKKKPNNAKFAYMLTYKSNTLGFWMDSEKDVVYCTTKIIKDHTASFVIFKQELTPSHILLKPNSMILKGLKDSLSVGAIYFDKVQSYNLFMDLMQMLNVK